MRALRKPDYLPAAAAAAAGACASPRPRLLALPFADTIDARALHREVLPWLAHFGVDSLSYFVATHTDGHVCGDMRWTTLPRAWSACYGREAYIALDPRLTPVRRHLAPLLWDARDCSPDWRVQRFLADAGRHGIAGGVVISLYDGAARWATVTFDVSSARADATLRDRLAPHAGELLLIAIALHGRIATWPRARVNRHREHRGLSFRERDCLSLAARGLTSADIGARLSVAERTVNFHFRNIKTKLGAINRPEAIARGISLGILNSDGD
jgi:DNA-binding CsgD family transcriptional regulator